jgi:alpha-mannosidase
MGKPTLHLICNAHLDPVWQWRWEEGCSEALSTFATAVRILKRHKTLIFNHNEAVLYEWVRRYDPTLFRDIRRLVANGRWCISGGWYLQPDVNLPGTESIIRQIIEGRRFFRKEFKCTPTVAYNFDSFGHSGGLPQILRKADYRMYIHMRPQEAELQLPSDLYRWRGVDGSEILTYRIAVGLYHTERDNIEQRLNEGAELARRLQRDVPVFWGIGDHGGGPTEADLERIEAFARTTTDLRVRHSTPELLYRALRPYAATAPIVSGDLQRVFTGCYTSLSRLKRRAVSSLAEVVQAEAASTCAWWWNSAPLPAAELREAWRNHLFNDFHDILPGSCTEPAEHDALDQYGRASSLAREARLGAVASLNRGAHRTLYIPVTILNTNPSCTRVPVEVECMLDLRPKWTGTWHLALFSLNGREIPCQEEQPESLLPFNGWRRKVSFFADLPHVGAARYELRIVEGPPRATDEAQTPDAAPETEPAPPPTPFIQPIVVEDDGDAWGANRWHYNAIVGRFVPIQGSSVQIHSGPVRRTVEAGYAWNKSSMILRTATYSGWPVTEFTVRVHWHEHRKRLKLAIPAGFKPESILCEVPGGAINRPPDGEEHVHGRWCILRGTLDGRPVAMAVISSGQHGFDVTEGELRLSVLRSAAYCHEQGFALTDPPARKYMDQGVHEFRLLVQCGTPEEILDKVSGLADWLSAPPAVYAHLPIGMPSSGKSLRSRTGDIEEFLRISSPIIRLTACKQSEDTRALILRLQETSGNTGTTTISLGGQSRSMRLSFSPFEIKTIRVSRNGRFHEVHMVEES